MSTLGLEPRILQLEHRAVVQVLRAHPHWTLGEVADHLEKGGLLTSALRAVRVQDLIQCPKTKNSEHLPGRSWQGDPVRDSPQLEAARRARGEDFDRLVLAALRRAKGHRISGPDLRALVGGPRWKLLASLNRLIAAGLVERVGRTSATRYWASEEA